jgi:TonB-dependent Receptor Plug Domain
MLLELSELAWAGTPSDFAIKSLGYSGCEVGLVDDVVAVEHAPRLPAAQPHDEPDVVRAVQLLAGTVACNDSSIGYNVRGGESDQNHVRLDGVTIVNPLHLGGFFSTFDVNAVDHVDFLTGGFPAE